jgi:epoxyqueuosine reductase
VKAAAIKERARELGFDDCRITTAEAPSSARYFARWVAEGRDGEMGYLSRNAEKRGDPQKVLPGAKSIVSVAISYGLERAGSKYKRSDGIIARYAQFADYHKVLANNLKSLSAYLDELGGPDTKSLWYIDTGPLLERDFAQRAGIGFVGKHTNVISRRLGNWIFLAEVITTLELEVDDSEKNRCGSCTSCISACPTQAITAPFQLDARRCISYLTIELKGSIPIELRPLIGNRIYGCDDCLAVCPWNRFATEGKLMKPHARTELRTNVLLELLSLDETAFKQKFAGTPILRTKRRGFLRNVCVALGNSGDSTALPALEKAAVDPEPLIAEHATWAIAEIKRLLGLTNSNRTSNIEPSDEYASRSHTTPVLGSEAQASVVNEGRN